jgi:glutamyl-tRNA reductase
VAKDPDASPDALAGLAVVGLDHRTASPALRDALFLTEPEREAFAASLREAGLGQAIVLSTCDRLEVQLFARDPAAAAARIRAGFAELARTRGVAGTVEAAARFGEGALHHVFRVACALESRVAGEPQILGQTKAADRWARQAGMMGPELDAALGAAYGAAKRVRSETTIGERPTSMAAAALAVARDVHGELERTTLLLLGTGDLGEMMLELLRGAGLRRAAMIDLRAQRAEPQARRLGISLASFDALADALAESDIVVGAAGTGRILIDRAAMMHAAQRRRRRPVLLLDFAVPPDIDPAVDTVDGVYRYDADDLERIALQGRAGREGELARAEAIVAEECARFVAARAQRAAVPLIAALRRRFDDERRRALADAGGDAARATELMGNRLLHTAQSHLRVLASPGADPAAIAAAEDLLRALFALDQGITPE